MEPPNPEQIVTAIMDFEHALAEPHYSVFDPSWRFAVFDADRPPCTSAIFDPGLNPALYQRSRDIVWQIHAHKAARNLLYHHPFMPFEGTHCVGERSSDSDVLAVFVGDVRPNRADAYVISDVERSYSENTIQTNYPTEVYLGSDGAPVVRLSAVFMHSLLHGRDPRLADYFELPEPYASPGQLFTDRLRHGTTTADRCDLHLCQDCGGRTILLAQQVGLIVLLWEVCAPCFDSARDTARHALGEAEAKARRDFNDVGLAALDKWRAIRNARAGVD
jgi:hypothetical protein